MEQESTKASLTEKNEELHKLKQELIMLRTQMEICKTTHILTVDHDRNTHNQTIPIDVDSSSTNKDVHDLRTVPTIPSLTAFPEFKLFLSQIMERLKIADNLRLSLTNELKIIQNDNQLLHNQFIETKAKTKDSLLTIQNLEQANQTLKALLTERDITISNLQTTITSTNSNLAAFDQQINNLQQLITNKTEVGK